MKMPKALSKHCGLRQSIKKSIFLGILGEINERSDELLAD